MQRNRIIPGFAALLTALAVNPAQAANFPAGVALAPPTLIMTVDGVEYRSAATQRTDASPLWDFDIDVGSEALGFRIIGSASIDQDPSIAYMISVTDFDAPTTFIFSFSTPIVPGAYTHASASLSAELLDMGEDGVSAQSVQTSTGVPAQSLGVDLNLDCVTDGVCGPTSAENYDDFSGLTGMSMGLQFTLSGGSDAIEVLGNTILDTKTRPTNEVSEPGMLGLFFGGLLAFVATAVRRRLR